MLKFLDLKKWGFTSQKGFSFLEVLITTTIMAILFGVMTFNLLRTQNSTSKQSNLNKIVSDMRAQQAKAMNGSTEGREASDNYGIYFMSDRYILFHGASYSESEPTNFTVSLPSDIEIQSTTLPSNTLIFSALSGEMLGYSDSGNSITLKLVNTNQQAVVTLNRYGVVTSTN